MKKMKKMKKRKMRKRKTFVMKTFVVKIHLHHALTQSIGTEKEQGSPPSCSYKGTPM